MQITSIGAGRDRHASFTVYDQPDRPLQFDKLARIGTMPPGAEREAAIRRFGSAKAQRIYLGSNIETRSYRCAMLPAVSD